jgi:hypothetical protein
MANSMVLAVLRIRIHRIRMVLGLLDPDPVPLVRGTDPDPQHWFLGTVSLSKMVIVR